MVDGQPSFTALIPTKQHWLLIQHLLLLLVLLW
jgi:hypothetical protein